MFLNNIYHDIKIRCRIIYGILYFLIILLFSKHFELDEVMKYIRQFAFLHNKIEYIHQEKIEWIKRENKNGRGVLLMMNHICGTDTFFFYGWISFYTIVKSDLVGEMMDENESWLLSYMKDEIFEKCKFISYVRGDKKSGEEVKKVIVKTIQEGKNVIIFPEGTMQHCFQKPLPFKKGIFDIAYEYKIPIFTFSINYSKDVGFNRKENHSYVKICKINPDVKIYCNGIFYPQQYMSMLDLHDDIYDSISQHVFLSWD